MLLGTVHVAACSTHAAMGSDFQLITRWYISFVNALFVHVAVTYEPTTGAAPVRNGARGASAKTGIQGLQA